MCLSRLKAAYDTPLKEIRVGYKVIKRTKTVKNEERYYTAFLGYRLRKTLQNHMESLYTLQVQFEPKKYSTGFHIYKNKKDAKQIASDFNFWRSPEDRKKIFYKVIKIQYTDIVAEGIEYYHEIKAPVEVALSMKVL